MLNEADPKDINVRLLDEQLDETKKAVFLGKNAVFLGSLLCNIPVVWTHEISTAATNGKFVFWNPTWFLKLPETTRQAVLLHELWHVGLLHMARCDGKIHKLWNIACDIVINVMLIDGGYTFKGCRPWADSKYRDWLVEDVYDDLVRRSESGEQLTGSAWGHEDVDDGTNSAPVYDEEEGDMFDISDDMIQEQIRKVAQAKTTSDLAAGGQGGDSCGDLPGEIERILRQFFEPKLIWEEILQDFLTDSMAGGLNHKKRNRRYRDLVLPARESQGRLIHAAFIEDTSGSISDAMNIRFNSEVRHIKETFCPEKLSLLMFDTRIQSENTFLEDDYFDAIKIKGRGGTDLKCVYDWIDKNKPDLVVIFSDLYCPPMQEYKDCPILWICIGNPTAKVNCGTIIHIEE